MPAGSFQVKLSGEWKNYAKDEDKILKRAYLAGFPNARYTLRKQKYEVNFKNMQQKNLASGKSRRCGRPTSGPSQPSQLWQQALPSASRCPLDPQALPSRFLTLGQRASSSQ
ncbi:unnamed protein product [Polarella glacialis]|uniref:WWE domain-containing protein n=1 Tax=Polarella glacialis TaxID=89957 RepID=A0A813J7I2_POLGL|nr:unnamed protein product [Polarella glacialis]